MEVFKSASEGDSLPVGERADIAGGAVGDKVDEEELER